MPDISISVVVPNRNDARYLRRCIGSVREQEVPPDELIILDDVSSDDSVAVIDEAIAGCGYARLVRHEKNLGATENANEGLALAQGSYVHFLGANDFVMPGFYAAAKAALAAHPDVGLWSAMAWAVDEEGRFLRIYPSAVLSLRGVYLEPARVRETIYRFGNWLVGQTTIYRRDALAELGGFDPRLRALTDLFAAHVVAGRHGACFEPAPLAAMRLHAGSFLAATVQDETGFETVLNLIRQEGPRREPRLFTPLLLRRTDRRLRFASLRSVLGQDLAEGRRRMAKAPEATTRLLAWLAASLPRAAITGVLFLIMRPYDVVPTIWYRLIGTAMVAWREGGLAKRTGGSDGTA